MPPEGQSRKITRHGTAKKANTMIIRSTYLFFLSKSWAQQTVQACFGMNIAH